MKILEIDKAITIALKKKEINQMKKLLPRIAFFIGLIAIILLLPATVDGFNPAYIIASTIMMLYVFNFGQIKFGQYDGK
jgi:hypothetical protein